MFANGKNGVHGLKVLRFLKEQYIIPVKRSKPPGSTTFQTTYPQKDPMAKDIIKLVSTFYGPV